MPIDPFSHFAQWAPGSLRAAARTYAQYLASFLGMEAPKIAARVANRFLITGQLAGTLANNAVQFVRSLASTFLGRSADRMERPLIPRNSKLPNAYRAVVTVRLRDPNAPAGTRDPRWDQWRTLILDFDRNPSWGMMLKAARAIIADQIAPAYSGTERDITGWRFMSMELQILERRT